MNHKITPYKNLKESKKDQVSKMFDNIAENYDFLNHFLSLGIDIIWRKKAIKELTEVKPKKILDIATGTADLAIEAMSLKPKKIIGIDISEGMLKIGRDKIRTKNMSNIIELEYGDSEKISYDNNSFDAITAGFGVRNFENLSVGLSEIYRVLKKDGKFVVIEPSIPKNFFLKSLYNFYFKKILPLIGKLVSKDNSAYNYLPESVDNFPQGKKFIDELNKVGFKDSKFKYLNFGIVAIYTAKK